MIKSCIGLPSHDVVIRHGDTKNVIKLYSHYTLVTGDSGVGKTFFFDLLSNNDELQLFDITSDYPILYAESAQVLQGFLDIPDIRIIVVDEAESILKTTGSFFRQGETMRKLNDSHHLFICIGRSLNAQGDYPLQGMYELSMSGEFNFEIKPVFDLNCSTDVQELIVTEAGDLKSENYVLQQLYTNIEAAGGRNNVYKHLKGISTTVFIDLGNIGRAYYLLCKRIKGTKHNVYDYQCFEQLVYESDLVKGERNLTPFSYCTIEKMYEDLLSKSNIGYNHSKPLCDSIQQAAINRTLFTGAIGEPLVKSKNVKRSDIFGGQIC